MAAEDREDFLTEDAPVPGQNFCLLSFLSPENVLKKKDLYFFSAFLEGFEYTNRVKSFETFLMSTVKGINDKLNTEADAADLKDLSGVAQTLRDSRVRVDTIMSAFQMYVTSAAKDLKESTLKEQYDEFLYTNRQSLEDKFYALNEFRTTVRGLKIRGTYSSKEEAVTRSKKLQRLDPLHNIFVGEIGKWLPWDPEPSQVREQEYAEDELNTLMKKYKENEDAKDQFEREKRTKMMSGTKKPAVVGSVGEDGASTEVNSVMEQTAGMFSEAGPADLAMARKMGNTMD
jgi:Family of unknown function (DUF5832)